MCARACEREVQVIGQIECDGTREDGGGQGTRRRREE